MTKFRIAAALTLAASLVVTSQSRADEFQRTFVFHNTSASTIYPVIESPQNFDKGLSINCGSVPGANGTPVNGLMRIIVNKDLNTKGIPTGDSVTVAVPKTAPNCPQGGFYVASRIYMLYIDYDKLQPMLNANQQTRKYDAWNLPAPCPGCWVGLASSDPNQIGSGYPYDVPGQLLEYTIISQDPLNGSAFPNANNPAGRSLIDFDVSYVDYVHQPFAMALGDGGATQFMGSTFGSPGSLPDAIFPTRISTFIQTANWSGFDAYTPLHWAVTQSTPNGCAPPFAADGGPGDKAKTRFSCAIPFTPVAPSAAILIADANTGGGSQFFTAETWGGYSEACHAPDGINAQCGLLPVDRVYCCPDKVNGMQGCCDIKNFQVAKTLSRWFANPQFPTDPSKGTFVYSNPTLDDLVARFKLWRDKTENLCAANGAGIQQAPVINRTQFCQAYQTTINYVWNTFGPQCGGKGTAHDRCTVTKIIGYDNNSGYDPNKCTTCTADPSTCPASCVAEQIANESVQAIQRSLPWLPYGPPDQCGGCPSTDTSKCAVACVFPQVNSPLATPYQFDKFLHFWAPSSSVYNVNPYATFIHSPAGVAAPGAYSFSIDDFYGNFGGFASTLIIQAGGYSMLPNQEPFDPYKQYSVGFGPGWDHVKVCGRTYQLPAGTAKHNLSAPISFWNDGVPSPTKQCEVYAYPGPDETSYIKFLLTEVTYTVTDAFTGLTHQVQGLSGVAAPRGGSTPLDPYCLQNSTSPDKIKNVACSANLAQGFQNKDYVGVPNTGCTSQYNWTCGKPMISLNVPPPGLSGPTAQVSRVAAQR